MEELIKKYNIPQSFYSRYIEQNAENRLMVELSKFLWFRIGKFLNPLKKDFYLDEFKKEEIVDFYENGKLYIPQIEFNITTKCTLKCKDCCALIPEFNKKSHIEMTFEQFKSQLDKLCDNVDSIRHLILLGGEPLLNPDLPQMLDYACKKSNIDLVRITTNGTMLPSQNLLDVINANFGRAYFYLSNYEVNPDLAPILKYDKLKEIFHESKIKFQMADNLNWLKELGMAKVKFDSESTKQKAGDCYRLKCTQILNGKIDVCSKALGARELGEFESDDYIDLMNSKNLREDFIKFYSKDFAGACEYCILSDEVVQPALQNVQVSAVDRNS